VSHSRPSALLLFLFLATLAAAGPLRFRITLDPELSKQPLSGRMFVLMSNKKEKVERITTSFVPGESWISAMEIDAIGPGQSVLFNPDSKAYPKPFSRAAQGSYQFMALFDLDHSYAYNGPGEGDLYSAVVQIDVDPANADVPVELHLSKVMEGRPKPKDTASIRLIEFESKLLSAFWGRPIVMRAGLVLPPSYAASSTAYPAVYNVHGFGGTYRGAWGAGNRIIKEMQDGKQSEKVNVFLDASFPSGHHAFADSVNNGPWGRALTEEFIPYLESHYRLIAKPHARFLTGHSSGGWSTLWLQVTYPDFFGGTWSTAPDSISFKSFTGVDATSGSTENAFRKPSGEDRNLVRMNGKDVATLEEFVRQEEVAGPVGGQMASFDWVFSPRGPDGRPMKLFNRTTGDQDPFVQQAWEKYDINLVVQRNWAALGPKLLGKVHLIVGSMDNFHLEEAALLFCGFLKSKGREDACEIVPDRDHMNLYRSYQSYPDGLALRIASQMQASFEKGEAAEQASQKGRRRK
jgi:hypothetical protein